MSRARLGVAFAAAALVATTVAASRGSSSTAPVVTHEIIAVYLGTDGTDGGMVDAVRNMQSALLRQTDSSGRHLVTRGVSLDESVAEGIRHLATLGTFDEISVGGNWTNSSVVRYLGNDMSDHDRAAIPQVVLLEREVRLSAGDLVIGPEREIGRYMGTDRIRSWVRSGAPLPR